LRLSALLACLLLGACAGAPGGWDGRRGYDGNGDYGYDLDAPREARAYRAHATGRYRAPGPPEDPWGPHLREASRRFGVPERWLREVMRQESGGRLYDSDGRPITSSAGAMGLMQVMPGTYDILRRRHGLGPDPYEPRDNILAGAAYIQDMHQRFGAPGFLAAYNAGPERVEAYLAGSMILPDETVAYVASIAPRLGTEVAFTSPVADWTGGLSAFEARGGRVREEDRAYAGGGLTGAEYATQGTLLPVLDDPSRRAFEGGGLVTTDHPTGRMPF
jgi:hypothetical protein